MQQLVRLQAKRAEIEEAGGALVAISVDRPRDAEAMLQTLSAEGTPLEFPVACDPRRAVVKAMGVYDHEHDIALPSILILDADRRVAWSYVGESVIDRPEEEGLVETLRGLRDGRAQ